MPERQIDYLIVGQGLAGSLLAYSLIKNGQSVMVIDNEHKGSSSQVAAGTINPITGHRLNITEHFQRYYSAAQPFYQAIEHTLGTSIFREIPQIRLIKNAGQADYFKQRMQQAEYRGLLSKAVCQNFSSPAFGCANISQTALVDTRTLLQSMQAWLISLDAYRCRKVDYQQLRFSGTGIPYDDICAQRVVFCEGYQAINNPWLSELPFKLAKGDILTLEVNPRLTSLHNWGHWLVPATNNTAKLGASFEWQDLSLQPSTNVAEKLLSSLRQTTRYKYKVVDHDVGIRPTTRQRQPFVGPLSNAQSAYCLNGLGSKGCLIAPFYVNLLTNHLLDNTPLPKDITQWL